MNHNILFLLRLWPFFGGGETVTICLANEFARRGYGVHILYFKYTDDSFALPIDKRIRAVEISDIDCDETHANESDSAIVSTYLFDYVVNNNIDFVINQWWPANYTRIDKSQTNVKIIKCLHTSLYRPVFNRIGWKGWVKQIIKPLYLKHLKKSSIGDVDVFSNCSDKFVCLSNSYVRQYYDIGGRMPRSFFDYIPNPLVYSDTLSENEFEEKENIVLFVGRLVDDLKRLSIVLKSWHIVESKTNLVNWKLVIVGDGPDKSELEKMASDLQLGRVVFEGFRKPVAYLKKSRIFVMTSRFEGFPMALIEAQQFGCVPVVMDSFLCVHDMINSGTNGIITLNNQTDFTKQLISLMDDSVRIKEMGLKGIEKSNKYRVDEIVNRWERLFDDL